MFCKNNGDKSWCSWIGKPIACSDERKNFTHNLKKKEIAERIDEVFLPSITEGYMVTSEKAIHY
jgi:hypothetical protein